MRISVILLLALSLSLVAGTFAFTGSYYTDSACNNSVASPFNGVFQPVVASINQCFLAFNNGSTVYAKATFCNSTFSTFENFNDAGCTAKIASFNYVPNICFSDGLTAANIHSLTMLLPGCSLVLTRIPPQ
jgi:hypothetical protein